MGERRSNNGEVLMMDSAEEFVKLRTSARQEDYLRAANDNAPLEVWTDVIERFPQMREWVAHNKTVPVSVLRILASDPNPRVRFAVAMKNKLPGDLMALLAGDAESEVRQRIACNKNVSLDVLKRLATDQSEVVSSSARRRLQSFEQ
jgi:hypothetical protein